jgi:ribosomal protein S6 kinase alpha-4
MGAGSGSRGQAGTFSLPSHQAFNRGKREGFFLKSVENAPLAKRRKQKLRSAAASRRGSPAPAAPTRAPASAKGAPRRANGPLSPS